MGFGDLAAQRETDAGAAGLGGEEGHEHVGGVLNAGAIVEHPDVKLRILARPSDFCAGTALEDGVGGVVDKIDEKLLELVGIPGDGYVGAFVHGDFDARFELSYAGNPFANIDGRKLR